MSASYLARKVREVSSEEVLLQCDHRKIERNYSDKKVEKAIQVEGSACTKALWQEGACKR